MPPLSDATSVMCLLKDGIVRPKEETRAGEVGEKKKEKQLRRLLKEGVVAAGEHESSVVAD